MKDHIIICGFGQIGYRAFELLTQLQQNITVISKEVSDDWRWRAEQAGCVIIIGDARNDNLLLQAGIKEARAILAVTDEDIVNVSIAMDARKLNPQIKIISRMFDTKLGRHISRAFDVQQVFSTSEIAAPVFTSSIYQNGALAQFDIDHETYTLFEEDEKNLNHDDEKIFTLATIQEKDSENTVLVARLVEKGNHKKYLKVFERVKKLNFFRSPDFANLRRFLFVTLSVIIFSAIFLKWAMPLSFVDSLYFVVTTVTTVGYGDISFLHSNDWLKLFGCFLMFSGATALAVMFSSITEIILSKKLRNLLGGQPLPKRKHAIIIGASHVANRVVEDLVADGIQVVGIETDVDERFSEDIKRRIAIIEGKPRNEETLMQANVKTASAIIALTHDDVENLSVSLVAKKLNKEVISIAQIFNSRLGGRLQGALALNRVLSASNIAAPYFAAAVFGEQIILALKWRNHLVFLSRESDVSSEISEENFKLGKQFHHNVKITSMLLKPLIK